MAIKFQKGTILYCSNLHKFATVVEDIYSSDVVRDTNKLKFREGQSKEETVCTVCGANFFSEDFPPTVRFIARTPKTKETN